MIENKQYRISKAEIDGERSLAEVVEGIVGQDALRWYIGQVTGEEIIVEATVSRNEQRLWEDGSDRQFYPGKCAVLNIVPTGVGCNIGGYAGDAAPVTNLLAYSADYLITNPNALNASDFIGLDNNKVLFTDGCCIDLFCKGAVDLRLPYSNRVGLIVERVSDRHLDVVFNVVNAVRAIHGVNVVDVVVTDRPIGGRYVENGSGAVVGALDSTGVLFEACERLIRQGVNAIAITSTFQDVPLEEYARHFNGEYPNPVGGIEAIISYSVTDRYRLPSAHAPLINVKPTNLRHNVVDARGAGEMASESGLACILIGLKRAPQISEKANAGIKDIVNINNLLAVVAPASCLGGIPMLYAEKRDIPVIAVEENQTVLEVFQSRLGLTKTLSARSYAEAAGMVLALKAGISLESIYRPLKTLDRASRAEPLPEAHPGSTATDARAVY